MADRDTITQKLNELTEKETPQSLSNFWQTLKYKLSQHKDYAQFLEETWKPPTAANFRGLLPIKDDNDVTILTGLQRQLALEMMLGSIATRIPVISHRFITHQATSLQNILNRLRLHYGFTKTGGRICDLGDIRMGHADTHETVWERLCIFIEDNLLDPSEDITHEGQITDSYEILSPTLQNVMVVLWLNVVKSNLPALVKERFATELRNQTLYSIREEISVAIPTLLAQQGDSSTSQRTWVPNTNTNARGRTPTPSRDKICWLCTALGKRMSFPHFYRECPDLPILKRYANSTTRSAQVSNITDDTNDGYGPPVTSLVDEAQQSSDISLTHLIEAKPEITDQTTQYSIINRVDIEASPTLVCNSNGRQIILTLDSGGESNLISKAEATRLGLTITPTRHAAQMADGSSRLKTVGETHFTAKCGHHTLTFGGLVAESLNCTILAGMPFHKTNDVFSRPGRDVVHIGDCCEYKYGPQHSTSTLPNIRVAQILRVESGVTLYPGESVAIPIPPEFQMKGEVAIEPRIDAPSLRTCKNSRLWFQPSIETIDNNHEIYITNTSPEPIHLKRHEQICNARHLQDISQVTAISATSNITQIVSEPVTTTDTIHPSGSKFFSDAISVDPDQTVSPVVRERIVAVNHQNDEVFDDRTLGRYNGASGPFKGHVNVGPTIPPQRKGVLPTYPHTDLVRLQKNCDELENYGVLMKPEDLGVQVEHLNTTFLVGGDRVVTSFGEVAQYVRPQPSLLPSTDDTIRAIGKWKKIIKTDLSKAYRQIPLTRASLKYCGICTPYKGVRCYTTCAMGMPGSETALEELLCRVLGDIMMTGKAAKVADDLYCGGETVEEALQIWSQILEALARNGLRLSAAKTVIFPSSTTILGWKWNEGTLEASPHRLSALENCELPVTVRALRGFIGAYSFLHRVIPGCSLALAPLQALTSQKLRSSDKIVWSETSIRAFRDAQKHLSKSKAITLPRPSDQIQIQTDGSVSKFGLGATMFIVRDGNVRLAGFFSAKLRPTQMRWMPCEIEALGICCAIRHFSPYIIESQHRAAVFTDSRPCVQAYGRMCHGRFSASMRVSTFLSALCNYGVTLQHIPGPQNMLADYSSRDPPECTDSSCQVCKFVEETASSVVRAMTVSEALADNSITPFASRAAWTDIQHACPQLESVRGHLSRGTQPHKKKKNMKDIRRYLNKTIIARDGLIVVQETIPFIGKRERIVVPRKIIHGLVTALHLRLQHPSKTELCKVFARQFFALDADKVITSVVEHCDICSSLSTVPSYFKQQSTATDPTVVGCDYSADIIRRCRQYILVVREKSTSFTCTGLVANETASTLRESIISVVSRFRSTSNLPCTIRVDPAPGFRALKNDEQLRSFGIVLEIGDEKNVNKNPISEKAIRELHGEFRRIQPMGGPVSESTLAIATSLLNSRIRHNGLSALEMWTKRDQYTGQDLPIKDREILRSKLLNRLSSHTPSAKYKARGRYLNTPELKIGDLVYLIQDRDKTKTRARYLITNQDESYIYIKKFTDFTLMNRPYRVKAIDCLPIHPTTVEASIQEDDSSDSESENEDQEIHDPAPNNNQAGIEPDNGAINHAGIEPDNDANNQAGIEPDNDAIENNYPRRPERNRIRPAYLDDYNSGSEFDDF